MSAFEIAWSLFKGFLLGNGVLALLIYLEFWWKRQENAKQLKHKKMVLDQMEQQLVAKKQELKK